VAHSRVMLYHIDGFHDRQSGGTTCAFIHDWHTLGRSLQPLCLLCAARRFTGHVHGKQETFGRSPVMCELETAEPAPPTLLFARTRLPPVVSATDAKRDPCNQPAVYLPNHNPANLWPK